LGRITIASINVNGLRDGHKFSELARTFKQRNLFCAGISECWHSGDGVLHRADADTWFVYRGLPTDENTARGKWGIGFMLSGRAKKLWKKSGCQLDVRSARVGTMRVQLNDGDNRPFFYSHAHGHSAQQDAGETQRAAFFADLDAGLATVQKGDFTALTMDTNCSIGIRSTCSTEDDAARSVCGRHGDPHVNSAGDFLKSWLMDRCTCATSTHFRPPSSRIKDGYGTWKHVRNHRTHQNDHIFVKRALLPRVASCRNAAPLCHSSDHLAVRAQFRVRVRLQKKKKKALSTA
jgi:hypothetical protein